MVRVDEVDLRAKMIGIFLEDLLVFSSRLRELCGE